MIKFMNKLFFPFSSDKYNLETKWWHRLLKILYFLVSIIILILSFFIIKEWFWNDLENLNNSVFGNKQKDLEMFSNDDKQMIQTALDQWIPQEIKLLNIY